VNCPNCKAGNAEDARFCGTCGHTLASTEASNPKLAAATFGEAPSLIGREIAGRYRMQAKLGEGGMGTVYKAEQISLKRTVAVKLLRPEVAGAQMLLRRFNAEAEAVAKLSHPNTVNIYDFGQDSDGTLFIAMEYIEGQSLRNVIHQEAPLPLKRALSIAAQVAASLTDAHGHSIVHRDLKPDNVMIQARGRQRDVVRVLDFGIAKLRDENRQSQMAMTQAGDMLGTPQYMSPEQIRGEPIDGRTDIYSLGGMLYEMVTGRLPFEAPTVMALLSKHLLETITPPSQRRPDLNIPPAIDNLILGAMAKNAADRPATMELFGEQIAALLATFPADSGQATAQNTAAQPVQTRAQPAVTPPVYSATPGAVVPFAAAPTAAVMSPPPPPPGAAPYNPYGNAPPPAVAPPTSKGGGIGIWVFLGLLVVAGIGTGVYFGVVKKNSNNAAPDKPTPGSDVVQAATPDAAQVAPPPPQAPDAAMVAPGDDPWQKGGGTTIVPPIGGSNTPTAGDDDGGDDTPEAPPTPKPRQPAQPAMSNMPRECTELVAVMEAMSRCQALPEASRQQVAQAAQQMRKTYGGIKLDPATTKQVAASCKQGGDSMRQAMAAYNCPL
jgi:serine/threonine-protein kinase